MPNDEDQHLETPLVLHDAPLRQSDTAYFHFDPFARTLARLIASQDTRTPLAIGISGAWGSGKTTLLQRTRKLLEDAGDLKDAARIAFVNPHETPELQFRVCRTVWFDAWKYSGEDQILAALLRVIVAEMQRGNFWDKVKAALTGPKKEEVKWLGLLLNALTNYASAGSYDLNLADFATETPLKEAAAFFDYFDESLTRLLASWVGGQIVGKAKIDETHGVMVVFIDDLDRCLPAKTVQVLEAIKLFLDKPGCVFVFGAHVDVIQQAVASYYKDVGVTGESARDYLDKVIQLRFQLPPILDAEMGKFLDGAQDVIDDEVRRNWRTIVTGAEINPRKVKRFVNDVNLQWAMLENTGQARGVNRDDFTRWQVLRGTASSTFMDQVEDLPTEPRRKFIDDAIKWAKGGTEAESVAGFFKAYEGERRLIKVLRMVEFSPQFTADALDAFLHMTQPPEPVAPAAPVQEPAIVKEGLPAVKGVRDVSSREVAGAEMGAANRRVLGGLEFVRVPKGSFLMGSKDDNPLAYDQEKPQHTVELAYDYWIARFPVTNDQFAQFVKATQHETTVVKGFDWRHPLGPESDLKGRGEHPVVQISWYDAMEYCNWLNQQLKAELGDLEIRLPTEAEWEKAARGEYGNEWPWGNEFDPAKCNSTEGGKGGITPVGTYSPQGNSPYGAVDMVGNVWEWTLSLWGKDTSEPDFKYPYDPNDGREDIQAGDRVLRVVRGGAWSYGRHFARGACRQYNYPDNRHDDHGVRTVVVALGSLNSGTLASATVETL